MICPITNDVLVQPWLMLCVPLPMAKAVGGVWSMGFDVWGFVFLFFFFLIVICNFGIVCLLKTLFNAIVFGCIVFLHCFCSNCGTTWI